MGPKTYRQLIFWGTALLIAVSPILRGTVRPWSLSPVLAVLFLLVFMWLWRLNNHGEAGYKKTPLDVPIAIFLFIALISLAFSIYKTESLYSFFAVLGYVGLYYLVVCNFGSGMIRRAMSIVVFTGAALSAYGLLQYFNFLPHEWWMPEKFLGATYVNHNHFSGYLELAIPLALGILVFRKNDRFLKKVPIMVSLAVMSAALIFAQSRGALASLFISFLVMGGVLVRKKMITGRIFTISALLAVLIFSLAYLSSSDMASRLMLSPEVEIREASLATRVVIWKGTLGAIAEKPFIGSGIGAFRWLFLGFRPEGFINTASFAHNDYLHMAAEMGVPGALALLWMIAVTVLSGFKTKAVSPEIVGCAAGVLSLAIHGLVDFNFHIPANTMLVAVYAAFIMGGSLSFGEGVSDV